MKNMATTPSKLTEAVSQFCRSIVADGQPIMVPVRPVQGGQFLKCHSNVALKIEAESGTCQYGWLIWEESGKYLEAEFHAVWRSPEGELLCVTPHRDGETAVLFLPDSAAVYTGVSVPSRRLSLTADPAVRRMLEVSDAMDQLKVKYADKDGNARIPVEELEPLVREFQRLKGRVWSDKPNPRERAELRRKKRKEEKRR